MALRICRRFQMAKAAKKPAAKTAAKAAGKATKVSVKAKPEKKAAPAKKAPSPAAKKETHPKIEAAAKKEAVTKKEKPKAVPAKEGASMPEVAPVEAAPAMTKKEKAAKAAADKILSDEQKKWSDLKVKFGSEKASVYSMSAVYEPNTPLQHKVLGWGYILSVQNDRLEVLFESGPKMLISNYKPS
jgi:hypothetical protein